MTSISLDKAFINYRSNEVRGVLGCVLRNTCFYRYSRWNITNDWHRYNLFIIGMTSVTVRLTRKQRERTIQIPIARYHKLTASQHPAVSSLEACQTPAR